MRPAFGQILRGTAELACLGAFLASIALWAIILGG
jgi:hypothetical protein